MKRPPTRRTRATLLATTAGLALAAAVLPTTAAGADQLPGVRQLRAQLGTHGVLALDPDTGTARQVARLDGYLTRPTHADPADVVRDYLRAHPDVFGLSPAQIDALTLRKRYTDIAGTHHLSFIQSVDGVPVFGNGVKGHVSRDGRLISVLGAPVSDLPAKLAPARVTGAQAKTSAAKDLADPEADPDATVKQVAYVAPDGAVRRAWRTVTSPEGQGMWLHVIDAATGEVLHRQSLSADFDAPQPAARPLLGPAAYGPGVVLAWDHAPGDPRGGEQLPRDLVARGWLPAGAQTLNANPAHVYSDVNDNNRVDAGEEITPAADGSFAFPFTPFTGPGCGTPVPCSWDASTPNSWQTNRAQAGAQLMYFLGKFHDHLLAEPIGFTRAAGNFDARDGDAVEGNSDDGAARNAGLPDGIRRNDARISTPPDGQPPRIHLYLTAPQAGYPIVQGNYSDNAMVVYHEYTHGLSHRLVTDAHGVAALSPSQSWALGEAWSDWYALDFLAAEGLREDDPGVDGEVKIDVPGWIDAVPTRTQPLDCPVGSASPKCPGTPTAGPGGYTYGDYGKIRATGREAHTDGEIWSETLWDLRTALGSKLTESLVTRAMELSPEGPSFLDQRNAVLQADTVVNGGRARDTIWKVFAGRGMGYRAVSLSGADVNPVEDFSLPPGTNTPPAARP
ncbi:M36 family metallopeptidase [Streptomyces sp. NPDC004539]|uniref:M36 family metallopeptidase n=1 Tax=Streptomyces sp. NPDC004539 TaxID=3154280 RepID=UPI0033BD3264